MAKLGYDADPTDVGEGGGYTPIAVGNTIMQAINAEIETRDDGMTQVVWEFQVSQGPQAGFKHREWVRIKNPNGYTPPSGGDPARIGQQLNNSFAAALGLVGEAATDTDNYLFKDVSAYVKAKKPYTKSNGETVTDGRQIGSFKAVAGNGAAPQTAGTAATTNSTQSGASPSSKPNAMKNPDDGKWYDDDGNQVPVFKLSGYNKIEG